MTKTSILFGATCLVALALFTTSCAREYWTHVPERSTVTDVEIGIVDGGFMPATMRITKGDEVVWTNEDDVAHSVTSASGHFDIVLEPGETYRYTFDEYGSFEYSDRLDPTGAAGTVTVNFGRVAVNR